MQLDFEFYKVFIKTQSLYNPIFLQDFILTIPLLDYPMAPSPLRGAPSRREPRRTSAAAKRRRLRKAFPLRGRWHGSRGDFLSVCMYSIVEP